MINAAFKRDYKKILAPLTKESEAALSDLLEMIADDSKMDSPAEVAYILATVWWETFIPKDKRRFVPVMEYYGGKDQAAYFEGRYGPETAAGKRLGNVSAGDAMKYRGRGYVGAMQGLATYRRVSKALDLGEFLVKGPSFVMVPMFAYRVLSEGMRQGLFTGKRLADYWKDAKFDFVKARGIMGGKDKAAEIAAHAEEILRILNRAEEKVA